MSRKNNSAVARGPLDKIERRLSEALDELYDNFVDPRDAFRDEEGLRWREIGSVGRGEGSHAPFASETEHREIRQQCRALAASNEYAINGHENRISYIVGAGHVYRAVVRQGESADESLARLVQRFVDEFIRKNDWSARQEEIVRRRDRDGEAFLRFFHLPDGRTTIRFVEPDQIAAPARLADDPTASFGVAVDKNDVETVRAYYIDGQAVSADEIQHRKANVDANVKRGLPLFYPVRKNLRRAEKLLRNMSILAEIQSAVALIRRHAGATGSGVRQFAAASADSQRTTASGISRNVKHYPPGTILDTPAGIEYEFPTAGLDASAYVSVLKAELRAIASRLVMPEFMLTSDASNANYASTLVAEGPAVKMFSRLQARQIAEDREVFRRVLWARIRAGQLPEQAFSAVDLQIAAPSLEVRDELKQVRAFAIEHARGVLSTQTWSQRRGLDYDQEQANWRQCAEQEGVARAAAAN